MTKNKFLSDMLKSEEFTSHKSFSKEMVYSDPHNRSPTRITLTNSDFGFVGELNFSGWLTNCD
jgi:hypothetical protein